MIDTVPPFIQLDVELLSIENENPQHQILAEAQVEVSGDIQEHNLRLQREKTSQQDRLYTLERSFVNILLVKDPLEVIHVIQG